MNKSALYGILFCYLSICAQENMLLLPAHSLHDAGNIKLYHDGQNFLVQDQETNQKHTITKYDIDKKLNNLKPDQLKKVAEHMALYVKKIGKKDYKLEAKVRGKGGGPLLAACVYTGTKVLGYGVPSALLFLTGGAAIGGAIGTGAATATGSAAIGAGATAATNTLIGHLIAGPTGAAMGGGIGAKVASIGIAKTVLAAGGASGAKTTIAAAAAAGPATIAWYGTWVEFAATGLSTLAAMVPGP